MTTEYRLYNSAGCDLGMMTQAELFRYINTGTLADGDTIKVTVTHYEAEGQVRETETA